MWPWRRRSVPFRQWSARSARYAPIHHRRFTIATVPESNFQFATFTTEGAEKNGEMEPQHEEWHRRHEGFLSLPLRCAGAASRLRRTSENMNTCRIFMFLEFDVCWRAIEHDLRGFVFVFVLLCLCLCVLCGKRPVLEQGISGANCICLGIALPCSRSVRTSLNRSSRRAGN
jgi:hypothetical protein